MKMRLTLILICIQAIGAAQHFEEPWGKDSDLTFQEKKEVFTKKEKRSVAAKIANQVIVFHQKVLSPSNGPRSHFRPSSSQYMKLAIERYGFLKGYLMGCDRLLRENNDPWIYQTVNYDGMVYKYDPAKETKHMH